MPTWIDKENYRADRGSKSVGLSGGTVVDHGTLAGLNDDDHPQYHTDARGDARYAPVAHVGSGGSAHAAATTSVAGFMSSADKTKLDGIAPGATAYTHPNHSGDVTSVGDGAQTIANNAVTNAKAADMANGTIKGRSTAGTGDPEDLTAAQVRALLSVVGLTVPAVLTVSTTSTTTTTWDSNGFAMYVRIEYSAGSITSTLATSGTPAAGQLIHFVLKNTSGGTVTLSLPGWKGLTSGTLPTSIAAGKTLELSLQSYDGTTTAANMHAAWIAQP